MKCGICNRNEAPDGRRLCDECIGNVKDVQREIESSLCQVGMTCERCGTKWTERDFTGPGQLKKFHLNENLRICCWRVKRKKTMDRKNNGAPRKTPVQQPPVKEDDVPEDEHVLILDFTKHQQLLNSIIQKAEQELRTPENQILWWMISTL